MKVILLYTFSFPHKLLLPIFEKSALNSFENNYQILFFASFRSDVLGQFMPLVGKDWTQSGVARLFCAIKVRIFYLFIYASLTIQFKWSRIFKAKMQLVKWKQIFIEYFLKKHLLL